MSFAIEEVKGKASNLFRNKAFLMIAAGVGVLALFAGRRRQQEPVEEVPEVAFSGYPQAPADYREELEGYKTIIESQMSQGFSQLWSEVQRTQEQQKAETQQQIEQLATSFQSSLADFQQSQSLNGQALTQVVQDLQTSYQSSLQTFVQNMTEQNKALMEKIAETSAPKPAPAPKPSPKPTTPAPSKPAPKPTTPKPKSVYTKPVVSKPDPKQTLIDKIDNPRYNGPSIVDYLKGAGVNSSFSNRAKIAKQLGIKNYTGTAAQNTQMLKMLKSDDKKK